MNKQIIALAVMIGSFAASGALAQDRWDWSGGRNGDREVRLMGPGVPILYGELRDSARGRAFVIRNFDLNRDGIINRREAEAANRAFAGVAGPRRDRFDWSTRDRAGPGPQRPAGGWDRRAMHDYQFRQTPRGATLNLSQDVLFATDSDVLRPGAIDRLRPLASYLEDQRGVQVAIDGYTDSTGSAAHNQDLSERRAASVRNALGTLGVTRARFKVIGHGAQNRVASNATTEGKRQNRRVEVTLIGQRADTFSQAE